eukprot:13455768-Heterocapsa_arctica.AAC.1
MGHEVQICGDYEYCLGCGRNTKTKHSILANRVFWRREYCKPVIRMKRHRRRNHDIIVDGWWACQSCLAKRPALNKMNCINPTHKHVEDDGDDDSHRHKRRRTEIESEGEKNDDRSDGAELGIMIE